MEHEEEAPKDGFEDLLEMDSCAWRLQISDPEESVRLALQIIDLARERHDERGVARANITIALFERRKHNPPELNNILQEAFETLQRIGDRRGMLRARFAIGQSIFRMTSNATTFIKDSDFANEVRQYGEPFDRALIENAIAAAYLRSGDLESALRHYLSALDIAREGRFFDLESIILANLGDAQYFCGDFENARSNSEKALALVNEHGLHSIRSLAAINLSEALIALGNPEHARIILDSVLESMFVNGAWHVFFGANIPYLLILSAQVNAMLNDWEKADDQLARARIETVGRTDFLMSMRVSLTMGLIEMGRGLYAKALHCLEEAAGLMENAATTYSKHALEIWSGMSRCHASLGDWKQAYEYSLKYQDAYHQLHNSAAQARLLTAQIYNDLARAERERDRALLLKAQAERDLAYTDSLTKLPNFELIKANGDALLNQGKDLIVFMLNILRFDEMNDSLGHDIGNEILIETGRRLNGIPNIMVCRYYTHQFCIILTDLQKYDSLRSQVESRFAVPFSIAGQTIDIQLSAGIARSPKHGTVIVQLAQNASIALQAIHRNHQEWLMYTEQMVRAKRSDLSLFSALRNAVKFNELRMYVQPKTCLADGCVSSVEALIRWQHPGRGLVPPGDFIPFAESTGEIRRLTKWMLYEAMRFTATWRASNPPLQLSVNVSIHDFRDPAFVVSLHTMLEETKAASEDLRLEITESSAMEDPDMLLAIIGKLRDIGFSFALDDFGTGYSSMAYLQRFPLSELKIDRAFVTGVRPGSDREALLDSIISLGHRLGFEIVAEGVESWDDWVLLKRLKCDNAQGWVIAHPMPAENLLPWYIGNNPIHMPNED